MPLTLKKIITYVLLVLVIFIAIFPAIWMLSTSIKPRTERDENPPQSLPDWSAAHSQLFSDGILPEFVIFLIFPVQDVSPYLMEDTPSQGMVLILFHFQSSCCQDRPVIMLCAARHTHCLFSQLILHLSRL